VSQFTLHAVLKGNKPDFHMSMVPDKANQCFDEFVKRVEMEYGKKEAVESGVFGAKMEVELVNDGPVTLILDSQEIGFKRRSIDTKKESDHCEGVKKKKKKKPKKKIQLSKEDEIRKVKLILQCNALRNRLREMRKKKGKEEGIEEMMASCNEEINALSKEIREIISSASAASHKNLAGDGPVLPREVVG